LNLLKRPRNPHRSKNRKIDKNVIWYKQNKAH
jgi:hypothetical protein